jgi:predicted  nucleic acid-binding Zn-ribbon protein
MGIKDALERKLTAEIDKWEKDIAALEAKAEAEEASAEAQKEIHGKIDAVRNAIGDAQKKLDEVRSSGEDAAAALKDGIENTLSDVRKALGG